MLKFVYAAAAAAFLLTIPGAATAQGQPPEAVVSIYRAAPGHQVMLLKWLEQQQRAAAAAGVPATQLYVHVDGDSWLPKG